MEVFDIQVSDVGVLDLGVSDSALRCARNERLNLLSNRRRRALARQVVDEHQTAQGSVRGLGR